MASLANTWVCESSLGGIAGSNPAGGMALSLLIVVRCHEGFFASVCSLVYRSPTECGVSECIVMPR